MKRYQILMLALPVVFGFGCKAEDVLGPCDADITAKVESFSAAATALGTVSASITDDVFQACNNIAVAMGETAIRGHQLFGMAGGGGLVRERLVVGLAVRAIATETDQDVFARHLDRPELVAGALNEFKAPLRW